MYVNLFGNTVDYDQFRIIAKFFNKDMFVIEDAAQSFGARYKDIPSGKLGDVSVLSFDPTKNLPNYGSGGMILTDDFNLAEELLNLRDNGKISGHEQVGTNSKMSESDCAQMLVKLKYFDSWQERRNKIADYYIEHMYPYVDVLLPNEHVTHAWHKFVLRVNDRNRVQHHMTISGIETKVHYPVPLDVMGVAKNQSSEELHQSHHFSREVLSLPIYPELTDSEVERITDSVTNYYKNY
jgi:dTDP-4-amino-4,6-dideoxygalactose transaminase